MSITPTGTVPTTGLHTTPVGAQAPKKTLDKEVFLQLLVAQLRNQDPSAPMNTNEMMAQSSQLASMEQLTSLAETSRESFALQMRIAASGMVGQQVSFLDREGIPRTGTADVVDFSGAVPLVTVGTWTVPLDSVSALRARPATPPATGAAASGTTAAALIDPNPAA